MAPSRWRVALTLVPVCPRDPRSRMIRPIGWMVMPMNPGVVDSSPRLHCRWSCSTESDCRDVSRASEHRYPNRSPIPPQFSRFVVASLTRRVYCRARMDYCVLAGVVAAAAAAFAGWRHCRVNCSATFEGDNLCIDLMRIRLALSLSSQTTNSFVVRFDS